jgi:acetyl esterase/lipase
MKTIKPILPLLFLAALLGSVTAQTKEPIPTPERKPSDGPFQPEMIAPDGIILPLYDPDSPLVKKERIHEAEIYNSANGGKGSKRPITNVINIHNPTIEVHLAKDRSLNGTAVIIAPGGGHKILWVGPEGAGYIADFDKLGVTTIILRNRLRIDGYEPSVDAVNDAFQAIRIVRAHAKEWKLDPTRIGIMGFSAGAELSAPAALFFDEFSKNNNTAGDPLAKISARPDFVGIIYPGPTPFTKTPETPITTNVPPSFLASAGSGDQIHAIWAADYFNAMLKAGVPNLEMHIYGRGTHGVNRNGSIPYSSWMNRYEEWLRDLGFLDKPGTETKAATDIAEYAKKVEK